MNEIITKKTLEQSLNFFSELNLEEEDYANILITFKSFFKEKDNEELLERIIKNTHYDEEKDLISIMKEIINSKQIPHLNILLQKMLKHEKLLNDIQDYFLEKLI